MSYRYEVLAQGEWCGNGVRLATKEEADAGGKELLDRWTVPDTYRVVESQDPVNRMFNFNTGRPGMLVEVGV